MQIFSQADILLPKKREGEFGKAFSVIACDQFTSEKNFWVECESIIGDMPSTLDLILPEVFLDEADERTPKINENMKKYETDVFEQFSDSLIYVRRTQPDGRIRRGIVGKIDLECYDYSASSSSLVRPTERTVLERIPPRVKVREGATLELPHVMLLIDDVKKTVIEPLESAYSSFKKAYDIELMMGAGRLEGYFIDAPNIRRINGLLARYATEAYTNQRYGRSGIAPLLFAVGDGNHSLATARAVYESAKKEFGDAAASMPCRYALAELVNLHDSALDFEPIYRTVSCESKEAMLSLVNYIKERCDKVNGNDKPFDLTLVFSGKEEVVTVGTPDKTLPIAFVQEVLDEYTAEHTGYVTDYIHGEDSLRSLACGNTLGILFEGMKKDMLFEGVMADGVLPRKTFSMGHALDKRHYFEARKIK